MSEVSAADELERQHNNALLKQASKLGEPLSRVNYTTGMMLGVNATRAEQSYHLHRTSRLLYWLNGYGTIAGMFVERDQSNDDLLVVHPGIGIDRFGREALISEPYCVDLRHWIEKVRAPGNPENQTLITEAVVGGITQLAVVVRYSSCLKSLEPTVARRLNQATDAVTYGRAEDAISLRLVPLARHNQRNPDTFWGNHKPVDEADVPGLGGVSPRLRRERRRLHMFKGARSISPSVSDHEAEERAEILLAEITLQNDISLPVLDIANLQLNFTVVNEGRPFVSLVDDASRMT